MKDECVVLMLKSQTAKGAVQDVIGMKEQAVFLLVFPARSGLKDRAGAGFRSLWKLPSALPHSHV